MARIRYLNANDLAPEDRHLMARGLNLYRVLAHSPGAARAFEQFAKFLRYESALDPRLRELAILQIGYLTGTAYSFYGHVGFVSQPFGVTDDDIRDMVAETVGGQTALSQIDRTVLTAAREMTLGSNVGDATFDILRKELSDRALTDLIATISFYNAAVRFIKTMQVDIEEDRAQEIETYRKMFPLPSD